MSGVSSYPPLENSYGAIRFKYANEVHELQKKNELLAPIGPSPGHAGLQPHLGQPSSLT